MHSLQSMQTVKPEKREAHSCMFMSLGVCMCLALRLIMLWVNLCWCDVEYNPAESHT